MTPASKRPHNPQLTGSMTPANGKIYPFQP